MAISNLQQLFEHELQDLHSAETQIIGALPKMIALANHAELKTALEDHLEVTREQLERLNSVMSKMSVKASSMTCEGMKGILTEGEKSLKEISDPSTRDAAIIAAAQRVEHYEMAGYGTVVEYAKQLGLSEAADILQETLDEEGEADASLNTLATGGWFTEGLNEQAVA